MGSAPSTPKGKPTVYIFPFSAPCRSVLMAARAANIELDLKQVDLMKGEQNDESFLKINPDHTVPTLVDGNLRLWESRAVMQYLVDMYAPNNALYPRDPAKRALVDRLLQYDIGNVYKHVAAYIYPQLLEKKPADAEKAKDVENVLDYLEKILQDRPYVAAAHLTLADLSITAHLSLLEVTRWSFDRWPKVSVWRESIRKESWYDEANRGLVDFIKHAATTE